MQSLVGGPAGLQLAAGAAAAGWRKQGTAAAAAPVLQVGRRAALPPRQLPVLPTVRRAAAAPGGRRPERLACVSGRQLPRFALARAGRSTAAAAEDAWPALGGGGVPPHAISRVSREERSRSDVCCRSAAASVAAGGPEPEPTIGGSSSLERDCPPAEPGPASAALAEGPVPPLAGRWLGITWPVWLRSWIDLPQERVPWCFQTVVQFMILWFIAFWFMGTCVVPRGARLLGFDHAMLSPRSQALYSLVIDLAEGLMGLGILRFSLREHLTSLRDWRSWFRVRLHGGIWAVYVLLGAACVFPLVERLAEINGNLLPELASQALEQTMSSEDHVATMLYCAVVSVCAPIWEEIIFRGFLLQSLSRYLRPPLAVLASALVFAVAHFSLHRLLPLTGLGIALGLLFNGSGRNLLACMLLHSFWNCYVLFVLL